MGHIRIFKHYVHVPFLVLGIVEALVFISSIYLGAHLRFVGHEGLLDELGPIFIRAIIFALVMLVSMTSMGVYRTRFGEGISAVMFRTAVSFLFGSAALSIFFYAVPALYMGRGIIGIAAVMSFLGVWIVRVVFSKSIDESLLKRRVLILGAGERAKTVTEKLSSPYDQNAVNLVGYVAQPNEAIKVDKDLIIDCKKDLVDCAVEHDADEIVVAIDDRRKGMPMEALIECKLSGLHVIDVLTFFERETQKVEVDLLHPSWLVFSDGFDRSALRTNFERIFDIIASIILLGLTWPLMLFTIFAIKIEDGWRAPVFYRQERTGLNGKSFNVNKFRSMRTDAEKDGKAQWAQENDDRITKVGHFIRKYRIDELPQVFNVLNGDMGFVGPRPERPQFVEDLQREIPFFNERHRVKPGITGWAQLCYPYGASVEDSKNKLQYDLYYVKNHSLMLDLIILIKTVEVVFFGKGR